MSPSRHNRPYEGSSASQPTGSSSATSYVAEQGSDRQGSAIGLGDIYYTLFRHKWLILVCAFGGALAAYAAIKLSPPPFVSTAKLLVRYVQDKQTITASGDESRVRSPSQGSEAIMQTEAEILKSYDLALTVADAIGPDRIVRADDSIDVRKAAAGVIQSGLKVETRSSIISAMWEGNDPTLVQPVLDQIVSSYLKRHVQLHSSSGVVDEALTQQTDQLRARLNDTENELRRAKEKAGVISIEDAKHELSAQSTALEKEIYAAQVDVAERRTTLNAMAGRLLEAGDTPVQSTPEEKRTVYRQIVSHLQTLYQREQEMLAQFTPETPMVQRIRAQILENEGLKQRLEHDFPQLSGLAVSRTSQTSEQNASVFDPTLEAALLRARETRVKVLTEQLAEIRSRLASLTAVESSITELQRKKDMEDEQYRYFSKNLEQARIDEALGSGRVSGISVLQAPSPPAQNFKKLMKILMMLALGGVGAGVGLAFAIELFIDQSVRRPSEVESKLDLPLFMVIPRLKVGHGSPSLLGPTRQLLGAGNRANDAAAHQGEHSSIPTPLILSSVNQELRTFLDALRNRIVYNFEMRSITRKPKLVAVTSCGSESGVSTVAAGLAASLSETGDGNVLLVDMNPDRKMTRYFHRGDLKIGLDDVLTEDKRDDALVSENLYMVSQSSAEDRMTWVLPKHFASIVPKLKASDYDYIIFDLPPVSQISATPQIARFMDQVLMVVESGKTSRDAVKRAGRMLADAGATVGVILNKTRSFVPSALDSESMNS